MTNTHLKCDFLTSSERSSNCLQLTLGAPRGVATDPRPVFLAITTKRKAIKKNAQDLFLEGPIPDVMTFST